jgi:hypothetical protein
MCTIMVALYQVQDHTPVATCLKALNVDCGFAAVGTSRAEMREVLLGMGEFIAQDVNRHLMPGVFHFRGSPTENQVDGMLDAVDAHFPAPAPAST